MSVPLEGVIVVALEAAVAAPFATRQLADLGARHDAAHIVEPAAMLTSRIPIALS